MLEYLQTLFKHAAWADARVLAMLRSETSEEDAPDAFRIVAHLLAAERVWLLRLRGEDSTAMPIWPELSLQDMADLSDENRDDYAAYLAATSPEQLEETITYQNSAGITFHTRAIDILTHVALHGNYHRGQVARMIRLAGGEPINTDYITYVRPLSGS